MFIASYVKFPLLYFTFVCYTDAVPQIHFQHVTNNLVYKLHGRPFNLTATVVSKFNLTSLYWSPPHLFDPPQNRAITVNHGNMTTTTFMLLKKAYPSDSGNYILTAVNKCTQNSSQVYVDVKSGRLIQIVS